MNMLIGLWSLCQSDALKKHCLHLHWMGLAYYVVSTFLIIVIDG